MDGCTPTRTRTGSIGYLAVYLASSESDGMTGQSLPISGGMRMG